MKTIPDLQGSYFGDLFPLENVRENVTEGGRNNNGLLLLQHRMPGGKKKEEELGVLFPSTYVGSTSAKKCTALYGMAHTPPLFPQKPFFTPVTQKKYKKGGGGVGFCGKRGIVSRFLRGLSLSLWRGGEKHRLD